MGLCLEDYRRNTFSYQEQHGSKKAVARDHGPKACIDYNKAVRQSPDLLFIATSFWFEESPTAVRTNTAGLGRLCTLFVCSTLLVFEHTHAVLSSTLVLCCTMVTTSTAAMSNSRYADTDRMKTCF